MTKDTPRLAPKLTRATALRLAKVAGYHGDRREWTRLLIEARVSRPSLAEAFRSGAAAKSAGVGCTCGDCAAVQS